MKNKMIGILLTGLALTSVACTGKIMDKEADTADKAETYQIRREWQKVLRYNCDGKLVSDKVETVRSPTMQVTIAPKSSKGLASSKFKNLTNGSSSGAIVNNVSFTIDLAPAVLTMKVEEGINEISYEFYYCDSFIKDEKGVETLQCTHPLEMRESGKLFIKVDYQQEHLEGELEVKPTDEQCKAEEKPEGIQG